MGWKWGYLPSWFGKIHRRGKNKSRKWYFDEPIHGYLKCKLDAGDFRCIHLVLLIPSIDLIFKIIGAETIDATVISVSLSEEENEQIVFNLIWKPLKKSLGPLACQQIINLRKYYDLLRNKELKLEDVEWSDLDYFGHGYEGYQLLFLRPDGLYRIEFDSVDGEKGRLSEINGENVMNW